MMRTAVVVLLLLACRAFAADEAEPRIGHERAIVHTVAGDIVLAFYPDAAPETVKQVLRLMKLGVYDSTHFFRVEPTFVIQVGNAQDRLYPLRPEQLASIHKLPLEVVPGLKHHTWSLSMAHQDGDPNSGETSFSILLNDSPHLDGKYTVFGHVERGMDVVMELVKVTRDSQNRPAVRLGIEKVDVTDTIDEYIAAPLAGPTPVKDPSTSEGAKLRALRLSLAGGLLLIVALAALAFLGLPGIPERKLRSLNLVIVLVGIFLVLVVAQPTAVHRPMVGGLLFLALIGTFKILGRFESN